MNWKIPAIALLAVSSPCVSRLPDWYYKQDKSIEMPRFSDPATKIDLVVDGATLQALRVAADDFAPPFSEPRACAQTQAAHRFRVSRRGDIIFVEVSPDPHACGGQGPSLDSGGRYAISTEGRILRRVLDSEPEDLVPRDAGSEDAGPPPEILSIYPVPDGGSPFMDSSPQIDLRYTPAWMFDGGPPMSPPPAAHTDQDAGASTQPAAISRQAPDAGPRRRPR